MTPTHIDHPSAWTPAELGTPEQFGIRLTARHLQAFRRALSHHRAGPRGSGNRPGIEDFPLPDIAGDVAAWREQVHDGRALVLLRGFPVAEHPQEDVEAMYFGLGAHFGRPVSQSNMGDLLGHVIDVGGKDMRERAYRNSAELRLHTDRCDHIGMLCIRPAARGGESGYASAVTIHNRLLAQRPELLAALYRGFRMHRFGEQAPGEPAVTDTEVPIFSVAEGVPGVVYLRGYVDLAVKEGYYTLSDVQRDALDCLDAIGARDDVRLTFTMASGDLVFANNCLLLHTRTAFDDDPDPALHRHLMRLWLMQDDRPAAAGVRMHKGEGGIRPLEGRGTFYAVRDQVEVR